MDCWKSPESVKYVGWPWRVASILGPRLSLVSPPVPSRPTRSISQTWIYHLFCHFYDLPLFSSAHLGGPLASGLFRPGVWCHQNRILGPFSFCDHTFPATFSAISFLSEVRALAMCGTTRGHSGWTSLFRRLDWHLFPSGRSRPYHLHITLHSPPRISCYSNRSRRSANK